MKKIIGFFCLFFVAITAVVGQNIEKYYTSSVRGDEAVYFIFPMKKYKSSDSPKELEYDVTYNHLEDSVTFNLSFFFERAFKLDQVQFTNNEGVMSFPAKILFIEPKKKLWEHRISLKIPYESFVKFYSSSEPLQLSMNMYDKTIQFNIDQKNWNKQAAIVSKIVNVIELNRNN